MQTRKNGKSPMRALGAVVAHFRMQAQLTQRELADRMCVHEETIASIEQGRRALLPDFAEQLDRILDTRGVLTVLLKHLPEREKYPVWAQAYMDLEQEAEALSWYESTVIPGLLQTEEYARATFRSTVPALSDEKIELRVTARMERRAVLQRTPPVTASFVISEAAVRSRLGGSRVMHEQIRHLRACADLTGVSIQIMPLDRETHAALDGPFTVLETPEHRLLAYMEVHRGSQLISDPEEVSILARKYGMLRTQALNVEETKGLLDRLLGEP
ncbi:helix-turn-helix transcriptional regulator [Streptomyces morookaense]|uniref:helix-turn-helix domain-containing protein n=1 Tax=Streptomyces morookaense TaxID=1970 RepID=UPI0033ED0C72